MKPARSGVAVVLVIVACGSGSSATRDGGVDGPRGGDSSSRPDTSRRLDSSVKGDGHSGAGDGSGNTGDSGSTGDSGNTGDSGQSLTSFPASSTIYEDISNAAVDSAWDAILAGALANGWGNNFQLDPSFTVNYAAPNVARRSFTQPSSAQPDCDTAPVPVPPGGATEGYPNYFCATAGDDCHLLVYQGTRLYELYQGSITGGAATGGTFTGSCLVVWDLTHDYWQPGTPFSRGDGCNGADAADMPVAPLLLKKAEIAAHAVNHAMRFTITNAAIDSTFYVHPATHLGGAGPSGTTLPYSARLRLKKTFDVTTLGSAEAQAVAVALQTYGMFMDDGGNFFVSATNDITDVIDTHALAVLKPTDFEMVDGGTRINFHQQNCTRTPIAN